MAKGNRERSRLITRIVVLLNELIQYRSASARPVQVNRLLPLLNDGSHRLRLIAIRELDDLFRNRRSQLTEARRNQIIPILEGRVHDDDETIRRESTQLLMNLAGQ